MRARGVGVCGGYGAGVIRTYRVVDGGRVDGEILWVFGRVAGDCQLTTLSVYADGLIDSGTTPLPWSFEDVVDAVERGELITEPPDDGYIEVFGVGAWTMTDARSHRTAAQLVAEVEESLDRLNGRPTVLQRLWAAAAAYGRDPSDEHLAELRTLQQRLPDGWDWGLDCEDGDAVFVVLAGVGGTWGRHEVTPEKLAWARGILAELGRGRDEAAALAAATVTPVIELRDINFAHPEPVPDYPNALRNEYPAPLTVDGRTYPSLHHAFHALSTDDPAGRDAIAAEKLGYRVPYVAEDYPRRDDWDDVRLAVMTELLRGKFRRYPDLADMLVSTGDARLVYQSRDDFWGERKDGSPHWMGRLLEMVRSEVAAARAGVVPDVR